MSTKPSPEATLPQGASRLLQGPAVPAPLPRMLPVGSATFRKSAAQAVVLAAK